MALFDEYCPHCYCLIHHFHLAKHLEWHATIGNPVAVVDPNMVPER